MAEEYKVESITIKLFDKGDSCACLVTMEPPPPEKDSMMGNEQPSVMVAYAILSALMESSKIGGGSGDAPFEGMRALK